MFSPSDPQRITSKTIICCRQRRHAGMASGDAMARRDGLTMRNDAPRWPELRQCCVCSLPELSTYSFSDDDYDGDGDGEDDECDADYH